MHLRLFLLAVPVLFGGFQGSNGRVVAQSPQEITNSIGMKLVLIPKGTFQMGSPPGERGRRDEENQHWVTISTECYLGIYEVTQEQYESVTGTNPSEFKGDGRPVEQVNWEEAVDFCRRLSDLAEEKAAGRVYRLPAEAEWEYACRAGSKSAYYFNDDPEELADYGWYTSNSEFQTQPAGQMKPNAWGLYDMHGNVWEWCADWYGDYPTGEVTDPAGPGVGSSRVVRGGSWFHSAVYCRSANRSKAIPAVRSSGFGFRVALNSPSDVPE
jgi:formylglycine-generating enzyme required for sulfatase activity